MWRRAHPHYWTCNQDSLFNSFCMLRCHRNHSAFNSHNFPRTCTTTYLFSILLCHSNRHAPTRDACRFGTYLDASGCTYGLVTVYFHSIRCEVSFDAVSAHGFARSLAGLLATTLAIVYSVYSAYLPGLHSARPSALVEGEGFEPPRFSAHGPMPLLPSSSQPTFLFCMSLWHSDSHPDFLIKSHHSTSQLHKLA